jgi:hypothetical protein
LEKRVINITCNRHHDAPKEAVYDECVDEKDDEANGNYRNKLGEFLLAAQKMGNECLQNGYDGYLP